LILKKVIGLALMAVIVLAICYDVTFTFDVSLARQVQSPDPVIAAKYLRCYETADETMHGFVFATVDNPDVQKEMISTSRERIARECRQQIPEQLITLQEPARFNVMDLNPRFCELLALIVTTPIDRVDPTEVLRLSRTHHR
jgi:hypothetical protein